MKRATRATRQGGRGGSRAPRALAHGHGGSGSGGGTGSGNRGGGGEGDEHRRERAFLVGLGALGIASLLTEHKRDAAHAADVSDAVDIGLWLNQICSAVKGRGRLEITPPASSRNAEGITGGSRSNLLVGKGSAVASVAFMWKTLLCWCTEDVELASTATDLGFLSFTGVFSLFAITEEFRNTRTFLLQACLSHIFLETVFEWGVLKMLEPEAKRRISWDMVIHHIGSLATGIYCTRVGGAFCTGDFLKQGARLACTEVTTGFPVAFKAAVKSRRFKGKRRAFFAVAMPVAFVWRSLYTLDVLKSFLRTVEECGGRKAIPSKWLGVTCFGSVVGCNMYWTARILSGVVRTLTGRGKLGPKKGKKKEEGEGKGE